MPDKQAASGARPRSHFVAAVTALVVVLTLVFVGMDVLQVRDIDSGIVEAVAVEQDGYVQLVLDQINLQPDRTDEEIINDILGTLDTNGGRYWTFSRGSTMLFVKDVSETSRYRSLMAESYFDSGSGQDFLNELSKDEVTHDVITIEGEQFVASGALFDYGGSTYRLCLLTNRDMLLSSNAMLGSRSRLIALLFLELGIFLVLSIYLAMKGQRARDERQEANEREVRLGESVERLNARLLELRRGDGVPASGEATGGVAARGERHEGPAGSEASAGQEEPKGHEKPSAEDVPEVLDERLIPIFEKHTADQGIPCERLSVPFKNEARYRKFVKRSKRLSDNVLLFSDGSDHIVLLKIGPAGDPLEDQVAAVLKSGKPKTEG